MGDARVLYLDYYSSYADGYPLRATAEKNVLRNESTGVVVTDPSDGRSAEYWREPGESLDVWRQRAIRAFCSPSDKTP